MERACKRAWRAVACLSERIGDLAWLPVLAMVIVHLAVPPSWVLDIKSLKVDDKGNVTLIRIPAHENVRAIYLDDMVGANGSTCIDWGLAPYELQPDHTTNFNLGAEFEPCLDDRPAAYSARWWPLLFGFLPLREIEMTARIE